jgi:hypothetical protein
MATFTITTTQNIDELTGKTGGDVYNINGGNLTIDQHSRFGLNNGNASATTATTMGNITLSATLGGTLNIDGRYIRMIPFNGGSGTIPALNSLVTQGSASGKLMSVYSSYTVAPLVNGGTMPATGWIMIKQWNSISYTSGALTLSGVTANATGADFVGFLEIMGDEAGTINANRLGTCNILGSWFKLGTTSGSANQTLQIPNNGTLKHIAGVFIEKNAGQADYEFYPNAGTATTIGTEAIRGKVVWISNAGLVRIGNNGSSTMGYTPISGLEVIVPNILLCNCTTLARNAVVIPNATIATRYDFTTTGGGVVNIDKANLEWYPSFTQGYSIQLNNSGIIDALLISECATYSTWSKVGIGNKPTTALLTSALTMSLCFAGGSFTDCVWTRVSHAASGAYTNTITDIDGFTFTRNTMRANTIRANATAFSSYCTRVSNSNFIDCTYIQGALNLQTCTNVTDTNPTYVDCVSGTTVTTYANYIWYLAANTTNCLFSGLSLPITNTQPYTSLIYFAAAGVNNCKFRNIGTRSTPLTMGSTNACGYIISGATGSAANNIKLQRIYCSSTRSGIDTLDNSNKNIIEEHVFGDYADAPTSTVFNLIKRGCGCTSSLTAQTSVYGTHWQDVFTSTTAGRIIIMMNEATADTTSQVVLTNDANFTSAGGLYMPTIGMTATFEMNYFALGHTSFQNTAAVMGGGTIGNYTLEFQIDKNDSTGYSSWTTLSGANLSAITGIDASLGLKLKIRITTSTTNTTAITSLYVLTNSTTTTQDYLYPLDTITLSLTGLISGSDIVILNAGTSTVLTSVDNNTSTSYNYIYSSSGIPVDIGIIKAGYVLYYIRNYTLLSSNASLPISQVIDRAYVS